MEVPKADPDVFLKRAKESVKTVSNIPVDELYIVWFVKVLQNWKALISTDSRSGHYWEVTYNGTEDEVYVDTYQKTRNTVIR
jgi:hypothetical protein